MGGAESEGLENLRLPKTNCREAKLQPFASVRVRYDCMDVFMGLIRAN